MDVGTSARRKARSELDREEVAAADQEINNPVWLRSVEHTHVDRNDTNNSEMHCDPTFIKSNRWP
jgi:hypothetical protein